METLPLRAVRLDPLPPPDRLLLPAEGKLLLTGAGSALHTLLAERLRAEGWEVVSIDLQRLSGEEAIAEMVANLDAVAGLIHLEPPDGGEERFPAAARARLKALFLLAKHLHPHLGGESHPRPAFLVATQVDGRLGLTGAGASSPIVGGYAGLTKSLALEWPRALCRTVDFDPALPPDRRAALLHAEFGDPDRRVREVAWNAEGRFTLIAGEVRR